MKGILKMKGLLTLFCCYLFLGNVVISWAEGNPPKQENIPLEGKWDEIKRFVTVEYPVRAYYDALNLYIEGTSHSDITIRVFNGGETVLEEEAPAGTLPVTVSIFNLQKGIVYQLELTNSWGNRLVGEFFVE